MIRVDGVEGRVAIVTGARQGIGLHIAETLNANGARVAGLDLEKGDTTWMSCVACDVSDEDAVNRAFEQVERELGPPSILVVNAGILSEAAIEETSVEMWRRIIDVNLTGAFLCIRRALAGMKAQQQGRIVVIGSAAGKTGGARPISAYAASKGGAMTLVKSVAREYARYGITVNALAPAFIDTAMIDGVSDAVSHIPVGRLGHVEDVGAGALFLCSSQASFITGEILDINGGLLMD